MGGCLDDSVAPFSTDTGDVEVILSRRTVGVIGSLEKKKMEALKNGAGKAIWVRG